MTDEIKSVHDLNGTGLKIYRYMLKAHRPLGAREIQRALHLSSPGMVQHHLKRFEYSKLVKHEFGNYEVTKVMLERCIKISHFIVPRYFFYSLLAVFALTIEIIFLQPNILNPEYLFLILITSIFLLIFSYETIKIWHKGNL